MSEEQLKAFLEAVKADAGLQEKLKAAKDANSVVEIAKAEGFSFSADELNSSQSEASEAELEGIYGGINLPPTGPPLTDSFYCAVGASWESCRPVPSNH